jgi:hypothetical protein
MLAQNNWIRNFYTLWTGHLIKTEKKNNPMSYLIETNDVQIFD